MVKFLATVAAVVATFGSVQAYRGDNRDDNLDGFWGEDDWDRRDRRHRRREHYNTDIRINCEATGTCGRNNRLRGNDRGNDRA